MSTKQANPKSKRSLRQCLRDLLHCRLLRSCSIVNSAIGSGILRRAEPSSACLPLISSVSLLPDFGSSQYNFDQYDIPLPQTQSASPKLLPPVNVSHQSLLPATSLSQYNLRNTYLKQAPASRHVTYNSTPPQYLNGASRQASLATLSSFGLRPSTSNLKLRESRPDLNTYATFASRSQSTHSLRRQPSLLPPRSALRTPRTPDPRSQSVAQARPSVSWQLPPDSRDRHTLSIVDHFQSFCVLDTAILGCPVTATSRELRYIFEIGELFFLNNQECEGTSMDIVTGSDAAGNPVTHLVLFSPLVSPSSGRSRFMLASLIDVTRFINETASLPDLDPITEEDSTTCDELVTPPPTAPLQAPLSWGTTKYDLSVEDLLGGCFVHEETERMRTPTIAVQDDVWLNLATEERQKCPKPSRAGPRHSKPPSLESFSTCNSTNSFSVDDVLDDFVSSLQGLYSDFFLLGKSPLDDDYYEICNVSPTLYASKDYVNGHLSRTPRHEIEKLSTKLAQGSQFSIAVRWGPGGEDKELYCNPLYGQSSITWVCFLVDGRLPLLW